MKVLIAPLNWGLGHATRCVPIVRHHLSAGDEVVLAGDGISGQWLHRYFPDLRFLPLPQLQLRYSASDSQVFAMLRSLPKLMLWAWRDHRALSELLALEHFDRIISDNRFGFYSSEVHSIYITHQLMIKMPPALRFLETAAHRLHLSVIRRYAECYIPDYEDSEKCLSGDLSHRYPLPKNAKFIGPLSRFMLTEEDKSLPDHTHLAILSGLEPQRTLLEQSLIEQYLKQDAPLIIVRGLPDKPYCKIRRGRITLVPYMNDSDLKAAILRADKVLCRSGYSTIMDLKALQALQKAKFYPTPGQTEQEYLAQLLNPVKVNVSEPEEVQNPV